MVIIYHCYGGTHSSPVAAALHLGLLRPDRPPTREELLRLPYFDRVTPDQRGELLPAGTDADGNRIFVFGRGPDHRSMIRALESGLRLAGYEGEPVRLVNTLTSVNTWMRVGGFMSRRLGWVGLGRPLVVYGTQRAFFDLVRVVEAVKAEQRGGRGRKDEGAVAGTAAGRGDHPQPVEGQ